MAGWAGKAAIGLILAGVVGAGVLFAVIRGYLHSDSFRGLLSERVSRTAGVEGRFTPFRWQGLAVDSDSFEATGSGPVEGLKVEGVHTEVGLGGLGRGVWELENSNIRRVEVRLGKAAASAALPTEGPGKPAANSGPDWLPKEVEMKSADVLEFAVKGELEAGPVALSGMRVRAASEGGGRSYRIETTGGRIQPPFPWIPELRMERAKLRWQGGQVFLQSAEASVHEDGRILFAGEWDPRSGLYAIDGGVSGLKCSEVFSEDWAKRVTGLVATDFVIEKRDGEPSARGHLKITDATVTALPMLDALAAYADTRRFRVLDLSAAHTDWRWKPDELLLTDLAIASEGLVRLEGTLRIRAGQLDGDFRLGLAPGTLAGIPGAETDVFAPGEKGLLWTKLRVTGTLDDPKEDLTDRLVAAAGNRMFDVIPQTGEKVIRFSRSVIGDAPAKVVDQGAKIIDEGAGLIQGVGGVLDGILGGTTRPEPEKKDESQ